MSPHRKNPARTRHILTEVPRVGFYPDLRQHEPKREPEDIIFPATMRAVMQYFGHPEYDYVHFVGVSGAMAFLGWREGWHHDSAAIYYMAPFNQHQRLFEDSFTSTGYPKGQHVTLKGADAVSEPEARRLIQESIDAGRPVLAQGVVGPPETCIICGYDEAAAVLIGWSFFQSQEAENQGVEFEPNGMFRIRDWYADKDTFELIFFGDRGEPPNLAEVRRRSLEWATHCACIPETWDGPRHNGLAAYDAWIGHLRCDEAIRADGSVPEGVGDKPYQVHCAISGQLAEARHYGSKYLIRVAQKEPQMRADLLQAAGSYTHIHDLMWQVWNCCGGNTCGSEQLERFAQPETRQRIIELLKEAQQQDVQAIEHIKAALEATANTPRNG
ncbi:MAG: hypothetical protein ACFB20_00805 [Opitutales bacterium]